MTPEAIIAELDRITRRQQQLHDLLRSSVGAAMPAAAGTKAPTEWLTTGQASQLSGLSKSQVARLCRQHQLADDADTGFARRCAGRWELWPARFHRHLRRRPSRRR